MLVRETIPAIDKTLSHVVAIEVMDKVRELLHFTNAIDLVYAGDDFKNKEYLLNYKNDKEIMENKIDVSYEEEPADSSLYFRSMYNTNKSFIEDKDLVVKPVRLQYKLTMNFKVISKSKTVMNEIADRLYRISMESFSLTHHFTYTYYLNKTIYYIMLFIHKYRTNYGLTTLEFIDFVKSISDTSLRLTYDNSGKPINITYEEGLSNITGVFKDISDPKIDFDKDTGYHTIDFSYEIEYSKLTYLDIFYNYVIANQFLPKVMIPEDKSVYKNTNASMVADMSKFQINEPLHMRVISSIMSDSYIKIPENDIDSKLEKSRYLNIIISGLTLISPTDRRSLVDLNQLGDIKLSAEVIDFIRSEGNRVVSDRSSIFQIILYADNKLSGIPLTIDNNLIVSSTIDLDLNVTYRIGIGIVNDIKFLLPPAYENYKAFRSDVLKNILTTNRTGTAYVNNSLIKMDNFFIYDIYSSITSQDKPIMKTVLSSFVLAMIKDK